jgi:CDGSH-type Zn-finger protein
MTDPVVASRTPYAVDVEAGRDYWWCTCGRSRRQPFCDGSHQGSTFAPMKYTAQASAKLWFCGCKRTAGAPLCDGSHKGLG